MWTFPGFTFIKRNNPFPMHQEHNMYEKPMRKFVNASRIYTAQWYRRSLLSSHHLLFLLWDVRAFSMKGSRQKNFVSFAAEYKIKKLDLRGSCQAFLIQYNSVFLHCLLLFCPRWLPWQACTKNSLANALSTCTVSLVPRPFPVGDFIWHTSYRKNSKCKLTVYKRDQFALLANPAKIYCTFAFPVDSSTWMDYNTLYIIEDTEFSY